jgi:DNA-3-methyladenine glycosylase II
LIFKYGETEIEYLKKKDKRLGEAIDKIGIIERHTDEDLFSSVVHHIVGQQISTAAQATIWQRMNGSLGEITAQTICRASTDDLQKHGISFKKAEYIKSFADKVADGDFDIEALYTKSDEEVIAELSALKGIGIWTAEMIMTFCMQRPDILSYGDLAIHRGMRMLYHHRNIDRKLFEKYRRRYSPYGTVASLYLWAIAGGAIPGMKDYASKKKALKK